jgi:SAM-dependent methyltransferase
MHIPEPVALVSDAELEASAVVANSEMNPRRHLVGVNSYTRELGRNPLDVLAEGRAGSVAWLDVCCGTGLAVAECARALGCAAQVVGLDLVDAFEPDAASLPNLELVAGSVLTWEPERRFDLITCVHGLHYVGDKLTALERIASWLEPDGSFVADFEPASVRLRRPSRWSGTDRPPARRGLHRRHAPPSHRARRWARRRAALRVPRR